MEKLSTAMQQRSESIKTIDYRNSGESSSIDYRSIVKDKPDAKEADAIIADCKDLIDDEKYKPFFYRRLYDLGKSKFLEQAFKARKYNRNGAGRLFVHLLK